MVCRIISIGVVVVMGGLWSVAPVSAQGVIESGGRGIAENVDERTDGVIDGAKAQLCGIQRSFYKYDIVREDNWAQTLGLMNLLNLFRNQCWRNTLWGIDDEREELIEQEADTAYLLCLLPDEAKMTDEQREQRQVYEDTKRQLRAERDFFGDKKLELLFDDVDFVPIAQKDAGGKVEYEVLANPISGKGLFDWLVPVSSYGDLFDSYWNSVKRVGSGQIAAPLVQFGNLLSDDAFALVFASGYFTELVVTAWDDWRAEFDYGSFTEYVQGNEGTIKDALLFLAQDILEQMKREGKLSVTDISQMVPVVQEFAQRMMAEKGPLVERAKSLTGDEQKAEALVTKLIEELNEEVVRDPEVQQEILAPGLLDQARKGTDRFVQTIRDWQRKKQDALSGAVDALESVGDEESVVQAKKKAAVALLRSRFKRFVLEAVAQEQEIDSLLKAGEKAGSKKVEGLKEVMAQQQAAASYFDFLSTQVAQCGEVDLSVLEKRIGETFDAITGQSDETQQTMAQRLDRARGRQFQRICSQLEGMYRQTGRDLSALPILGTAGGEVFCRAAKACPPEKTWAECSKEGLMNSIPDSRDPELSDRQEAARLGQLDQLSSVLANRQQVELLRQRQSAYSDFRKRYDAAYSYAVEAQRELVTKLQETNQLIFSKNDDGKYTPDSDDVLANQVSLLRHAFDELWLFGDAIVGACPVGREP